MSLMRGPLAWILKTNFLVLVIRHISDHWIHASTQQSIIANQIQIIHPLLIMCTQHVTPQPSHRPTVCDYGAFPHICLRYYINSTSTLRGLLSQICDIQLPRLDQLSLYWSYICLCSCVRAGGHRSHSTCTKNFPFSGSLALDATPKSPLTQTINPIISKSKFILHQLHLN